jgi:hypothetical protein
MNSRTGLFSFRSGGWVVALAAGLALSVFLWKLIPLFFLEGSHVVGDGRHVATYGFDLSG